MNPLLIATLLLILNPTGGIKKITPPSFRIPKFPKAPTYIDTFKMEMTLDRLRTMTEAIDKMNKLSQGQRVPEPKKTLPSMEKVQDSLDAVKGFLVDDKSEQQVEGLSSAISSIKKIGDIEELYSTMAPLISMLKNKTD